MPQIVINSPRQGLGLSPLVGFPEMRNLDIDSVPGVVKLNNIMVKKSSTTVVTQVNWIVRNPATPAEVYALDSAGKVYRSGDSGATWALMTGNTTTNAHGNGLAIFKNYLIVARDAYLDICGDGAASGNGTTTGISNAGWTNGWQAPDSDVLWHPMIVSKLDGKLYGGAGRYVFTLAEATGTFAPGTGSTYTWVAQALDLPTSYRIKCLEELGNNLMIGTWQGTTVTDIRVADIFTWDGTSVSYGQPIFLNDYGVHAMLNTGNSLVILAGTSGTIFRCDGVNAYVIGQLPIDLSGGKYLEWYPGALCSYKNKTFFGVGNGGTTAIDGMGCYSLLQTGKGNILNLEHSISPLTTGSSTSVKITSLLPITRDTLLVGWNFSAVVTMTIADPCVVTLASHGLIDGTAVLFTTTGATPTGVTAGTYYFTRSVSTNTFNLYDTEAHALDTSSTIGRVVSSGTQTGVHTMASYGIDLSSATSYAYPVDYSGYFVTPIYTVGSNQQPFKFTELEWTLAKPLRTGEGIKIWYRTNLTASFTEVETWEYSDVNVGAVISKKVTTELPNDIKSCELIQLKVALKGTSTTSPELMKIVLK
jgi:hypothetical protein